MLMTPWIRPPIVEILPIALFLLPKPCEVHDVENLPEETRLKSMQFYIKHCFSYLVLKSNLLKRPPL